MRIASLLALGVLACGTAFSAYRSESVTYIDGNIEGLKPHTGGVLVYSDEKALLVRTNSETIKIPYATVRKAELGGTISHAHDVPMYKVWDLPKRAFPKKTQTQYLTVDFTSEAGESHTMTLEVAEASASKILATIDRHKASGESSSTPAVAAATSAPTESASSTAPSTPTAAKSVGTPQAPAAKGTASAGPKTASAAKDRDADWFDHVWKTQRNADKWPQAGSVAAGGQE